MLIRQPQLIDEIFINAGTFAAPVVANGFLIECDLCYCEWCSCYDDCMNGGVDDEASKL